MTDVRLKNYKRLGLILCEYSILKKDLDGLHNSSRLGHLLRAERTAQRFHDICLPALDASRIDEILSFVDRNVSWINLRPNPCILIDGFCYELRNIYGPVDSNFLLSSRIFQNIEEQETRLKLEISREIERNDGFLMLHYDTSSGLKSELVKPSVVYTPREFFEAKDSKLTYYRLPLPKTMSILKNGIFAFLNNYYDKIKDTLVVFYSASGGTRTTFASCLYKLLSFSKNHLLEKVVNLVGEKNYKFPDIHAESSLNSQIHNLLKPSIGHTTRSSEKAKQFYEACDEFKSAIFKDKSQILFCLKLIFSGHLSIINATQYIIDYKFSKYLVDYLLEQFEPYYNLKYALANLLVKEATIYDRKIIIKANIVLEWYMTLIFYSEYQCHGTDIEFPVWVEQKKMYHRKFLFLAERRSDFSVFKPINFKSKFQPIFKHSSIDKDHHLVLYRGTKQTFEVRQDEGSKLQAISIIEGRHALKNSILLNLMEEPLIYIKGEAYLKRNLISYKNSIKIFESVTYQKLEEIENVIKERLIERLRSKKYLEYYTEEDGNLVRKVISDLHESDIQTPNEYFLSITENANDYYRFPITPNFRFKLSNFMLFTKLIKKIEISEKILYAISYNTKRAVFFCIWIDLVRKNYGEIKEKSNVVKIYSVRELIRVLDSGYFSLAIVDHLFTKYNDCDFYTHLKTLTNRKTLIIAVKRYFYTICFASYLLSKSSLPFDTWILNRFEICNMYSHIEDDVTNNDFFIKIYNHKNKELTHLGSRKGSVLSTMTILKNDYFKGFSLFDSMYRIDGIFNMRYIRVLNHLVVGCAMPKANAVKKLLHKILKEHQKMGTTIHWFCMREEPVIYVNNTPYVLRRYSAPYDNIEITGIDSDIVHKMEVQLKKDIYDEIKDNSLLVHDETLTKGTCVITHKWVEVEMIKTMREVYNVKSLVFHRVPISDERAPMPRLISYLYDTLCNIKGEMVLLFNCQMGRGRTTTFMILSYMTLMRDSLDGLPWKTMDYKKPRFIIIQQLLKFLPNARRSKKFADSAIDKFDHIENIRDIIEELAKSEVAKNIEKAQGFLLRYMYVICFAEFIIGNEKCFTDFLVNRPEIQDLVASNLNTNLEFI